MNPNDIATKQDIMQLQSQLEQLTALLQRLIRSDENQLMTINQLARQGIIGRYDRIKTLIRKGLLKATPDGKITRAALNEYLKSL